MKIYRITYLVLLFAGLASPVAAQIVSSDIDSVIIDTSLIRPVPVFTVEEMLEQEDTDTTFFEVIPWEFHAPLGARITATDSTLRWQFWPDWTFKLNREPGVITYRMGTKIRTNVVQRFAHEPRHQQLYWEGILLNDPVSGILNWMLVPQHKISAFYGQDLGTQYRSRFYLRQYYLTKPLSRLIYSESEFDNRDLQFEVSHNLSRRTNIQVSYWDRRAGGEYPNSNVTGRQIFAKVSHHLSNKRYLKLNFINNKATVGRPFGYIMADMTSFGFDRFQTSARQPSAESIEISSLLALNFYQRDDTLDAVDDLHASVYYRTTNRRMNYAIDTTAYKVKSLGFTSRKWWEIGNLSAEAGFNYAYFFKKETPYPTLQNSNWGLLKGEGRFSYDLFSIFELKGGAGWQYRSDGFQQYRLTFNPQIDIGNFVLRTGVSTGTIMPTPQQLYWQSEEYSGNLGLRNEQIQEANLSLSYYFTPDTHVGFRVQHKDISNGIMVNNDSLFVNVPDYASQSATAFFEWKSTHFEFETSATIHQFNNSYFEPLQPIPLLPEERLWLKAGLYWKGYVLNRAAYIKVGASGMMSPFRYQADHYIPVLDYWQPLSDDQLLPTFNSLDLHLSARVRSLLFVLQWKNVLDEFTQPGYFETAYYPMSQRHFMFSVRALFRN
ncbi:MAG TPA: putative porin [Balneolaceae bacterium]